MYIYRRRAAYVTRILYIRFTAAYTIYTQHSSQITLVMYDSTSFLKHLTYHSDWSHCLSIIDVIHIYVDMSDCMRYMMMIVIINNHLAILGATTLLMCKKAAAVAVRGAACFAYVRFLTRMSVRVLL